MRKILYVAAASALIMALMIAFAGCGDPEKNAAKDAFKQESKQIQTLLDERKAEVKNAQALLAEKEKTLDETAQKNLEAAVETAVNDETKPIKMPKTTEEINAGTEEMKSWEGLLKEQNDNLKDLEQKLINSRKQYTMLVDPEESFIIKRLKKVKNVEDVKAATKKTDPNNMIGKKGGYKSYIAFKCPYAQNGFLSGDTLKDGVEGGGVIEIYDTEEHAKKRDDYLTSFDGDLLEGEFRKVYGTIVLRLSANMKASKQEKMEKTILKKLTKL